MSTDIWLPSPNGIADAVNIQSAHDALPASGGIVRVGAFATDYLVDISVHFTKAIQFKGAGKANTAWGRGASNFVKSAALSGAAFWVTHAEAGLDGFNLDGQPGNGGDGIVIEANNVSISNVSANRQGGDGIRVGRDLPGMNANTVRIWNTSAKGNRRHGLYVHDGGYNANAGLVEGFEAQVNAGDGLRLGNAQKNTVVGYLGERNTGAGIYLTAAAQFNSFYGGDPDEANTGKDLVIEAGALGNVFMGVPLRPASIVNNEPTTTFLRGLPR